MTSNYFRIASWYVIVQLDQIGPCILNITKIAKQFHISEQRMDIYFLKATTLLKRYLGWVK